MLERASNISNSEGIAHIEILSSEEIQLSKRLRRSLSILGCEVENKLEKCEVKQPPIEALSEIQAPVAVFKKSMEFRLRLIRVEA
ncbi:hypothetical protein SLA2020_430640 [Shorea laevis]